VFETPVTGGNVSFYNEDPQRAVYPTPTIGMMGLVEHIDHITTQWFKHDGDAILLIGANKEELGASEYLHTIYNETRGPVPELDLQFEKTLQQAVLAAIRSGWVNSAHDVSDGGLAVALAEGCISHREDQIGATIKIADKLRADCLLFGETQSRIIISCSPDKVSFFRELCSRLSLPWAEIGRVGGDRLKINDLIDLPLAELSETWYNALPRMMQEITKK
jgi:phosphoribosylformylglycinamidine (FGAM) synthase-like enzyme